MKYYPMIPIVLKDSGDSELSNYIKNLDVLLSTRASESTLSAIKSKTDNLDVLLSTRASETTLSAIKSKTDNLDVLLSTRASETTLSAIKSKTDNLDIALSVLATLQRWGRNVSPVWVHGSEVTAPAANTALVSKTTTSGKSGYIYGFFISAGEANDFKINWTSGGVSYSKRIVLSSKGSLQYVDFVAFNEGLPADGDTSITITNVNAGSAGVVYQAAILYAEV